MPDQTEPEREPAPAAEPDESTEDDAVAEVPLNRAARRAKAKQAAPSHVGPRYGHARDPRGPRTHTKRR